MVMKEIRNIFCRSLGHKIMLRARENRDVSKFAIMRVVGNGQQGVRWQAPKSFDIVISRRCAILVMVKWVFFIYENNTCQLQTLLYTNITIHYCIENCCISSMGL